MKDTYWHVNQTFAQLDFLEYFECDHADRLSLEVVV
jgi:hypothetical protein